MSDQSRVGAALCRLFDLAVGAVAPAGCVPGCLPRFARAPGQTLVVGAGKAAAAMAAVVEREHARCCERDPGFGALTGAVVVPYDHGATTTSIAVREAAHPVPDSSAEAAVAEQFALVEQAGPEDLVLALFSGGGSALLAAPMPPVTLAQKRALTRQLLDSGAPIDSINCVRKHLSSIKGGRLAARCRAGLLVTLAISDVVGDDPAVIASGPTVADPTTCADAEEVVRAFGLEVDASVLQVLRANESPKEIRGAQDFLIAAAAKDAFRVVADEARADGFEVLDLGAEWTGAARDVAAEHADIVERMLTAEHDAVRLPCLVLSGGETEVAVHRRGDDSEPGRGGRNTEYLLALALEFERRALPGVRLSALAADTDGIDGSAGCAGAWFDHQTLARARAAGVDPVDCQARQDSVRVFEAASTTVTPGPTRTNVNDFRVIRIDSAV